MVSENVKLIVEKLKKMHSKYGGRTPDFINIEEQFYKIATISDLRYFYIHCRDEFGALFHEQVCISYMLQKTNMFGEKIFIDANLEQKKEILRKAAKTNNKTYITNMFLNCSNNFKKEQLILAKAVLKKGDLKRALQKKDMLPAIKDYLIKGACKKLNTHEIIDILTLSNLYKANKESLITSKQRELCVNTICKRKNIAYFTNYLFGRDILTKPETDKVVCALAKFGEEDQIRETIKFFTDYLSRDNLAYLQKSCNKRFTSSFLHF